MTESEITITINDEQYTREVEDRKLLIHFLREDLDLTGSHQGCVVGKCGACTVLHNGVPKKSCMLYASQLDGDEITTVEGLADRAKDEGIAMEASDGTELHPLQMGFKQLHGLQCGFCTPGMLMNSLELLESNPEASRTEIKDAISGNICRCTGYNSIVDSIEWAGHVLEEGEPPESFEGALTKELSTVTLDDGDQPVPDGGCTLDDCCQDQE